MVARPDRDETRRDGIDAVAVAHPDRNLGADGEPSEGPTGHLDLQRRGPVFAVIGFVNTAAQHLGDQLKAVADAEDRDPRLEDPWIRPGSARGFDRRRPAGEDDSSGGVGPDRLRREVRTVNLAVDTQLADPA